VRSLGTASLCSGVRLLSPAPGAENLLAFDSKFWLRMATRADAAENREEKERLTALANVRGGAPPTIAHVALCAERGA